MRVKFTKRSRASNLGRFHRNWLTAIIDPLSKRERLIYGGVFLSVIVFILIPRVTATESTIGSNIGLASTQCITDGEWLYPERAIGHAGTLNLNQDHTADIEHSAIAGGSSGSLICGGFEDSNDTKISPSILVVASLTQEQVVNTDSSITIDNASQLNKIILPAVTSIPANAHGDDQPPLLDALFEISVSQDDGLNWQRLHVFDSTSALDNNAVQSIELPAALSSKLDELSVKISSLSTQDESTSLAIDSIGIAYEVGPPIDVTVNPKTPSGEILNDDKPLIAAGEHIDFEIKSKPESDGFWQGVSNKAKDAVSEQPSPEIDVAAVIIDDSTGDPVEAETTVEWAGYSIDGSAAWDIAVSMPNSTNPGGYSAIFEVSNEEGLEQTVQQDFLWGVLALNFDKSTYKKKDVATVAMTVLNELGETVCNAEVSLSISGPGGFHEAVTTYADTINTSEQCDVYGSQLVADYLGEIKLGNPGHYDVTMTATTANGSYTINDSIEVEANPSFNISRTGPTRLYPPVNYPMYLDVWTADGFSGDVTEIVPNSFDVTPADFTIPYTNSEVRGDSTILTWAVDLKPDETIRLGYEFKAPQISPEFYLLGPATLSDDDSISYSEGRPWQLAGDALTVFRSTTYEIQTGEFTGTDYTLSLNNNLYRNYYTMIIGPSSATGNRGPDDDGVRVVGDPHANFGTSINPNELALRRGSGDNDWVGSVTVVECISDCLTHGFELKEVREVSFANGAINTLQTVTDTLSEDHSANTVPFGGRLGGGFEITGGNSQNSYGVTLGVKMEKIGTNQIRYERYGAENRVPYGGTMTTYIVEWGSVWNVQTANVTGNNTGNGINNTGEYNTATLGSSVTRNDTWIWGGGHTRDDGIGDGAMGQVITLGNGVTQTGVTNQVAVGAEVGMIGPGRDFQIYVMEHADLDTDQRFKNDGNSGSTVFNSTIDAANGTETYDNGAADVRTTEGSRFTIVTASSNGGGQAYSRSGAWSARPTSSTSARWWRTYSGQNWAAWLQLVDFADLTGTAETIEQLHFRWRDDTTDLNTTGGWLAAEDNNTIGEVEKEQAIRLRVEIAGINAGSDSLLRSYQLQYGDMDDGAGTCSSIPTWNSITSGSHFEMFDSANIAADGQATTTGLLANSEAFTRQDGQGREATDTTALPPIPLEGNSYVEHEYSFRPTYEAVTGHTYCFRVFDTNNATVLDDYNTFPEFTIAKVQIDNFIGEYGTTSVTGSAYTSIFLTNTYTNPVIVASPRYNPSTDPARTTRINNKASSSFDLKVDNSAGTLAGSTVVDWMVVESGEHELDNGAGTTHVEARSQSISNVMCRGNFAAGSGTGIVFNSPFTSAPAVTHTITSDNDTSWVTTHIDDGVNIENAATATGFEASLNRSYDSCSHGSEDVDYIAFEQGHGTNNGIEFDAIVSGDSASCCDATGSVETFSAPFSTPPETHIISQNGEDAASFDASGYGPVLWLDSDDPTTITQSGGTVSQINDKSGNSNNFTQANAGTQPQFITGAINGRSILRFDGTDDVIQDPNGVFGTGVNLNDFVFFIVMKDNTLAGNNALFRQFVTGDDISAAVPWGGVHYWRPGNTWNNAGAYGGDTTTFHVMRWESYSAGPNTSGIYRDGTTLWTNGTAPNETSNNSQMLIGNWSDPGATFAKGFDFAEIIVLDYRPSAGDIADIEAGLSAKWSSGVDGGFTSNHTGTATTTTGLSITSDEDGTAADRTHPTESASIIAWDSPSGTILNGSFQIDQDTYRWYTNNDNATPVAALTAESTAATNVDIGDVIRLRTGLQLGGNDLAANNLRFRLQYSENPSNDCSVIGSWTDVGAFGAADVWRGFNNPTPADGSTLPSLLLSNTDQPETYEETNSTALNPNLIPKGDRGEWDWVIENNGANGGTQYCFRTTTDSGDALYYTQYAELTTTQKPIKQLHYRWRDDTTNLNTSGGWLASEDTSATEALKDEPRRVRFAIANATGSVDAVSRNYQLQYGTTTGTCSLVGAWTAMDSGNEFNLLASSNISPDGQATSGQLFANTEAYSYVFGEGKDTNDTTSIFGPLAANSVTEIEFSIQPTYTAVTGTTYCFRLFDNNNSLELDEYTNYPTMVVSNTAFDNIVGEYGTLSLTNNTYTTVTLGNTYGDMVVVASPAYDPSSDTQRSIRIRNKTPTSFQIKVDNNAGVLSGSTPVDWIVMEAGLHSLDNGAGTTQFIAGSQSVGNVVCSASFTAGSGTGLNFNPAFGGTPTVLHSVTTENDATWISSTVSDGLTPDGTPTATTAELSLNRSYASCVHAAENIDYIAVEQDHGANNGTDFDSVVGLNNVSCCNAAGDPTTFNTSFTTPPEVTVISQNGEQVFDLANFNPVLWLDASDAGTLTTSGGLVDQWSDKSGNGNNFTATGANRPQALPDGALASIVQFDGVNDFMTDANGVFGTGSTINDFTVLIANKDNSLAGNNGKWRHDYTGDFHGVAAPWGGNHWMRLNGGWTNTGGYGGDITTYHAQRWESYTTGTNSRASYRDGVSLFSDAASTSFTSNNGAMTIGDWNGAGTAAQDMNVGEILVFDYRVAPADMTAIENYLIAKWQGSGSASASDGGFAATHTGTPITASTHFGTIDEDGPGADRSHPGESVGIVSFDGAAGELNNGSFQLDQDRYRWYSNIDNLTPPTSLAAEDTPVTNVADTDIIRLRLGIQTGSDGVNAGALKLKLQFTQATDCAAAGGWTDVDALGGGGIWRGADNPTPIDGSAVPSQLLSGTITLQSYEESNNSIANLNPLPGGTRSEWDWTVQNNNAPLATDYCFRVVRNNGAEFHYTHYPRLQTDGSSNSTPAIPTLLTQEKTDTTNIVVGGWTDETSVVLEGSITDPDNPDDVRLCVEVQPIGTAFTDVDTACSSNITYAGTAVIPSVTVASLVNGQGYHWQARSCDDDNACSAWVSFGANAETAQDFAIDVDDPTGAVFDGTSLGVDADFNNGSLDELSANWNIADPLSGVALYEYSIGTTIGGTDTLVWTSALLTTSVTATGLTLNTSEVYYFNIRITDNAGNQITISSDGSFVAPTLSFSTSPGNVFFDNLNSANNYSDSKTATLTTSTNAHFGYVIRAFIDGFLTSQNGDTITGFNGGSYAAPSEWVPANRGYGYTSNDNDIQGSNIFNAGCIGSGSPPCYAPFSTSTPGDIIADHTAPIVGSALVNENFLITHRVAVDGSQAAGEYQTTIIYVITASY